MKRQVLGSRPQAAPGSHLQPARAPSPPPTHTRKPSALSLTEFITTRIPAPPAPPPVNAWVSRANSLASLSEGALVASEPADRPEPEVSVSAQDFPSIGQVEKEDSGAAAQAGPTPSAWARKPAQAEAPSAWSRPESRAQDEEGDAASDAAEGSLPGQTLSKAQRKNSRRLERKAAARAAEEASPSRDASPQKGPAGGATSYPPSELSAADILTGERLLRAGSAQDTDESSGAGSSPCHGVGSPVGHERAQRALQRRVTALAALGFDPTAVVRVVGGGAGLDARAALRALLSQQQQQGPSRDEPLFLDLRSELALTCAVGRAADAGACDWEDAAHCWPCGGLFCGEPQSPLSLSDWIGDGAGRATCFDGAASFAVPAPCAFAALPPFVSLAPLDRRAGAATTAS